MTRADAAYKAGTYEAQAAYDEWLAANLRPGCLADECAKEAATRAAWARQCRAQTGRVA